MHATATVHVFAYCCVMLVADVTLGPSVMHTTVTRSGKAAAATVAKNKAHYSAKANVDRLSRAKKDCIKRRNDLAKLVARPTRAAATAAATAAASAAHEQADDLEEAQASGSFCRARAVHMHIQAAGYLLLQQTVYLTVRAVAVGALMAETASI